MNNSTIDPELLERIVQEVIRRLMQRGVTVVDGQAKEVSELILNEKLVTLATLTGRLNGARRVVVGKRSVVTPAVKDELRQQGIELVRRG